MKNFIKILLIVTTLFSLSVYGNSGQTKAPTDDFSVEKIIDTGVKILATDTDNKKGFKVDFLMLFLGATGVIFVYNVFLLLFLKERLYFYFLLYMSCFTLFAVATTNYNLYFHQEIEDIHLFYPTLTLSSAFLIVFIRRLLNTRDHVQRLDDVLIGLIGVLFVYSGLILYDNSFMKYSVVTVAVTTLILLGIVFYSSLKRVRLSSFTLTALLVFSIGLFAVLGMNLGILDKGAVLSNALLIGGFFEMLLLSLLLVYRLEQLEVEKNNALQKLAEQEKGEQKRLRAVVKEKTEKLKKANSKLEQTSITDRLTQVNNRTGLDRYIEKEIGRFKRYKHPLAIILLDIDHFKQVNDVHGHQAGDSVLVAFAQILMKRVRETDFVGRWGGEEFLIVCPDTDLKDAKNLAESIRKTVEKHDFENVGKVTSSFGVTVFNEGETKESATERVDQNLYQAKETGRNKVIAR